METPSPVGSETGQGAKVCTESEKKKLLDMSEISLILDTYDDIFSDFDPRPYAQRALSQDFLQEAYRASGDKTDGRIELKFLVPTYIRDLEKEKVIKGRLCEHFHKHYHMLLKEVNGTRKSGIILVILGLLGMVMATVLYPSKDADILTTFTAVSLEPISWFITYTGLEYFFRAWRGKKPELDFNKKLAKCEITFLPY